MELELAFEEFVLVDMFPSLSRFRSKSSWASYRAISSAFLEDSMLKWYIVERLYTVFPMRKSFVGVDDALSAA